MATTYDKASLVMIPSGYKDDKLFSIKPTDGSGDFTFSRDGAGASPATRVNASGLIEKGRENLALYSEQFDNAVYGKTNVTITADQLANPLNGATTADLMTATGTGTESNLRISNLIVNGAVQTISIYAKYNNYQYIYVRQIATNKFVVFDIQNGSVVRYEDHSSEIEAKVTNAGNGWYRLEYSFIASSMTANLIDIGLSASVGNFAGSVAAGSSAYIFGFQLEESLIATDYIETTTAPVSAGLLGDMPRLDYSGGATCGSLLLEPSRVNLVPQSEYFGAWTGSAIVTSNTTISPTGYQNATTTEDNTTGYLDNRYLVSITPNATYTYSIFVKKTTGTLTHYAGFAVLLTGGSAVVDYGIINTTTGAINRDASSNINSVAYSSVDYGDYWRVVLTFTDNQSNTNCTLIFYPAISTNGTSISQTAQGSNVFWGAQLEAGSYPTSYIPTYGSASTRGKDVCIDAGNSSTFNDSEGVLYAEISALANDLSNRLISLTNGTSTERISLFYSQDSSNEVKGIVFAGGVVTGEVEYNVPDITANIKVALKYKANDFALWINGVEVATDLSGAVPSGLDRLNFDLGISGSILPFFGNVKQTIYFPTALTDAELAALTA